MVAQIAHLYIIAQRYNFSFNIQIFDEKNFRKIIETVFAARYTQSQIRGDIF